MVRRTAVAGLVSALVVSAASAAGQGSFDDALLPVLGATIESSGELRGVVRDIETRFGVSVVREPEFVVNGRGWGEERGGAHRSLRATDLNFLTAPEVPGGAAPTEKTVMFWRGALALSAGPDVFLFEKGGSAVGVRIAPVYRLEDESLVEGEEVRFDSPLATGRIDIEGETFFGVGIDLDAWTTAGAAPEGGFLAGFTIRHDGAGGRFEPSEIVMAENLSRSLSESNFLSPLRAVPHPIGGNAAVRKSAGGSSGATPPDRADEVPSPGAATLFGIALAACGRRRRR